eukprot:2230391-Pyramimonas_sp.AAC.1
MSACLKLLKHVGCMFAAPRRELYFAFHPAPPFNYVHHVETGVRGTMARAPHRPPSILVAA